MSQVKVAFALDSVSIAIENILRSRAAPAGLVKSRKFLQIKGSIEQIGLIEPLSVRKVDAKTDQYLLLDGHLRLQILQGLGHKQVPCLLATDDEAYTYNNRINRLATIQEYVMIRRAVDRGVSMEALAKALSVNVLQITKKLHLLDGLCPEAIELLKDRQFSVELGRILGKMKPTRQVECAELMLSANNLTLTYASALLVATPVGALVEGKKTRNRGGTTPEQIARMEREMTNLQTEYRLVEQTYGQDVLNLVLAQKYLKRLVENDRVARFLRPQHADLLEQLSAIAAVGTLDS